MLEKVSAWNGTPHSLLQLSCALFPIHLCWTRLWALAIPAALQASCSQHLCGLQNAEITVAEKKTLSVGILKHRRFFFFPSHIQSLCVWIAAVDGNLLGSIPSLSCWFRPSIFHPLFPLRAVLAGQACSKTCCWRSEVLNELTAGRKEGRTDQCSSGTLQTCCWVSHLALHAAVHSS